MIFYWFFLIFLFEKLSYIFTLLKRLYYKYNIRYFIIYINLIITERYLIIQRISGKFRNYLKLLYDLLLQRYKLKIYLFSYIYSYLKYKFYNDSKPNKYVKDCILPYKQYTILN